MPKGPDGQKRPADVASNAVHVTRLTNGHSKKVANHAHMVALYTLS
jgi:hypothetical protein